jgi:hypothetical protein
LSGSQSQSSRLEWADAGLLTWNISITLSLCYQSPGMSHPHVLNRCTSSQTPRLPLCRCSGSRAPSIQRATHHSTLAVKRATILKLTYSSSICMLRPSLSPSSRIQTRPHAVARAPATFGCDKKKPYLGIWCTGRSLPNSPRRPFAIYFLHPFIATLD